MKHIYLRKRTKTAGALVLMMLLPVIFMTLKAQNPFGLQAADVFRCSAGPVTLTATVANGVDPAGIRWYEVPFYGTAIGSGATLEVAYLEQNKTYFIDYIHSVGGQDQCGICDRIAVRVTIFYGEIINRIAYQSSTFCNTTSTPQAVTLTGSPMGTFSADPAGLIIDAQTGAITPQGSTIGTYVVTYTPTPREGCTELAASTSVTIVDQLAEPLISYPLTAYCTATAGSIAVNRTGSDQGSYSALPAGLAIDATTGAITPSNSLANTYTISYVVPGLGGCPPQSATTNLEIEVQASASIVYESLFCKENSTPQQVTLIGTTGGSFTAEPSGLTINTTTGEITPSSSQPGTYTISYTLATTAICPAFVTTANVTINPAVSATIASDLAASCVEGSEPVISFTGTGGVAPFTFKYKVNSGIESFISSTTSTVTVTQGTDFPGSFTYYLLEISDANGCSASSTNQITIEIIPQPKALFEYSDLYYCETAGIISPTFLDNSVAGSFSASPAGLSINTETGAIDASTSTPGTYTVTNSIASSGGCDAVSESAQLTITRLQIATFNYAGSPYCPTGTAIPVVTDSGIFTAAPEVIFFFDVGAVPGTIDLGATAPGIWTITHTIGATGGCPAIEATATIEVLDQPNYLGTRVQDICSGAITSIDLQASLTGTSFTWVIGTVSPTTITGYAASTSPANIGDKIEQTLFNSSNTTDAVVEYIITPSLGSGPCPDGPAVSVFVTVKALPELSSPLTNGPICNNSQFLYVPTSNYAGISFAWTRNSETGSGTIDQVLSHASSSPQDIVYTYTLQTPVITGEEVCSNIQTVTVTVNPLPAIPTANDVTVAYDGTAKTASATSDGMVINWYDAETAGSATTMPTGTNVGTYTAWAEARYADTECISAQRTLVTLTINPVTLTVTADDIVRSVGASTPVFTYTITGFVGGETEEGLQSAGTLTGTVTFTDTAGDGTVTGTYTITPVVTDLSATNYVFTPVTGTLTIADVIVKSTSAAKSDNNTLRTGHNTLKEAYDNINDGIHTGEIIIYIYANTTETVTATLNSSGTGSTNFTSVSIIPMDNIQIKGTDSPPVSPLMIIGN